MHLNMYKSETFFGIDIYYLKNYAPVKLIRSAKRQLVINTGHYSRYIWVIAKVAFSATRSRGI